MVRVGERWGVLTTGMVGSNILKGMGSVFAGAHVTPDIDVFAGGVYRSQTDYRDGDGKEWPNTGFNAASGIGKLTIRPADGHEVKFTGLTYETNYINGQPTPRWRTRLDLRYPRAERHRHGALALQPARRSPVRLRCQRVLDPDRDRPAKDRWHHSTITGAVGDRRKFGIDTNGFDINNTSRADWGYVSHALTYGGDSFQDQVNVLTRPAPATCSRRTGGAPSPATSLSCGRTSGPGSKPSSRRATTPTSSRAAGSRAAASVPRPRGRWA